MSRALLSTLDSTGAEVEVSVANPVPVDQKACTKQFPITPSNDNDISPLPEKILIIGTGNIKYAALDDTDGQAITRSVVGMELIDEIKIRKIFATGTDAGNLQIIGMH